MKRLTVVYEVPDDWQCRFHTSGELHVVDCADGDLKQRLAAAEAERDEAREAAGIILDDLSLHTRTEWIVERWPWLAKEGTADAQ